MKKKKNWLFPTLLTSQMFIVPLSFISCYPKEEDEDEDAKVLALEKVFKKDNNLYFAYWSKIEKPFIIKTYAELLKFLENTKADYDKWDIELNLKDREEFLLWLKEIIEHITMYYNEEYFSKKYLYVNVLPQEESVSGFYENFPIKSGRGLAKYKISDNKIDFYYFRRWWKNKNRKYKNHAFGHYEALPISENNFELMKKNNVGILGFDQKDLNAFENKAISNIPEKENSLENLYDIFVKNKQ